MHSKCIYLLDHSSADKFIKEVLMTVVHIQKSTVARQTCFRFPGKSESGKSNEGRF